MGRPIGRTLTQWDMTHTSKSNSYSNQFLSPGIDLMHGWVVFRNLKIQSPPQRQQGTYYSRKKPT